MGIRRRAINNIKIVKGTISSDAPRTEHIPPSNPDPYTSATGDFNNGLAVPIAKLQRRKLLQLIVEEKLSIARVPVTLTNFIPDFTNYWQLRDLETKKELKENYGVEAALDEKPRMITPHNGLDGTWIMLSGLRVSDTGRLLETLEMEHLLSSATISSRLRKLLNSGKMSMKYSLGVSENGWAGEMLFQQPTNLLRPFSAPEENSLRDMEVATNELLRSKMEIIRETIRNDLEGFGKLSPEGMVDLLQNHLQSRYRSDILPSVDNTGCIKTNYPTATHSLVFESLGEVHKFLETLPNK